MQSACCLADRKNWFHKKKLRFQKMINHIGWRSQRGVICIFLSRLAVGPSKGRKNTSANGNFIFMSVCRSCVMWLGVDDGTIIERDKLSAERGANGPWMGEHKMVPYRKKNMEAWLFDGFFFLFRKIHFDFERIGVNEFLTVSRN